jgi:hypothetical protein
MTVTAVVTKPKAGRPKTPREIADRTELIRIASLASSVLICLKKQGRGVYGSERDLRSWLAHDEISYTSSDLAPALGLLEATGRIGRHAAKPNTPRGGWLIVNGNGAKSSPEPLEAADEELLDENAPRPGSLVNGASKPAEDAIASLTSPADALATAIIKAFSVGRGYQGNRSLCESETVLRQWLNSDGIDFDESDLPAALTRLETATLPGYETTRLLRGYALHRSYPITSKPPPARAMLLMSLHYMDATAYEAADISPYVV